MSTQTANSIPVKVPSVGESITSGVIGSWKKKNGEAVATGDALFEIETDKVTSEVFAETDGILETLVPEGTEVKVGQIVANIVPGKAGKKAAGGSEPKAGAAASNRAASAPKTEAPVKLNDRTASSAPASHVPSPSTPGAADAAPRTFRSGKETRRKMSPLRRKIADRLVSAQHTAAILTTFNEADLSNLIALRTEVQPVFQAEHGVKLGFMSFFLQASVHALKAVPALNARIEGDDIVEQHYYDIGVAVGTDRGLVVPVLRDCDQLDLAGLEKSLAAVASRAREGKLSLPDLEGGVFTISNGGIYGSVLSTPILNPPQSAILGLHAIQQRPVAVNGQVEIRPMMNLALSYDHRLIDGKEAVTFLIAIK
ncbi:MAG: dihydrolipoyllysine succinyltransferase, partial [Verrucomicrobia bacterium]|nr:dihydrolipoyllysine succinyltransferase [Verrucomicrobiota bacterium]